MNKTFSSFLSLNWWDAVKGLIVAVLSAVTATLYELIGDGQWPAAEDWKRIGGIAAAAAVGYIMKNWLSNSAGEPLKTEAAAPQTFYKGSKE